MKKVLSIITVIALLITSMAGLQSSAVKNYLEVTDETSFGIYEGAYVPSIIEAKGLPAIGSWAGSPQYKDDSGWVTDGTIAIDTETVKFGKQSIRIQPGHAENTSKSTCLHATFYVPASIFEAGKTYTFQAYVKTQKLMAEGGAQLAIWASTREHGTVASLTEMNTDSVSGTKDWTQLVLSFTMPEGIENDLICFSLRTWVAYAGTAWFDGVAVVEGSEPVDDFASIETNEKTADADPTPTEAPVAEPTLNGEPSAWAKEEIISALKADLVPAHVNSNYTTDITRSDFCDLIIKMIEKKSGKAIADVVAGYADAKSDVSFPDTDSANVIAAAKLGIVNGRSSGIFDPNANITRQEAAKMLALAAKVLGADIAVADVEFADAADIYGWAKEFINYVNTIGVMKGTSSDTPPNFSPLRTYTREQSILTVYRLFNAI